MRLSRLSVLALMSVMLVLVTDVPAIAHEDQVIQFGSFLGGLLHPVLGLDHFLAMVSVGIVSAFIGGRAIWFVPATFVVVMAVGGLFGGVGLGFGSLMIESAIAASVVFLGLVLALDKRIGMGVAMGAVAFFGFFHGYAHGQETPDIARPGVYATGFLVGTALIHLLGVLIGDIARRYRRGRPVLRAVGAGFVVVGALFMVGVL